MEIYRSHEVSAIAGLESSLEGTDRDVRMSRYLERYYADTTWLSKEI